MYWFYCSSLYALRRTTVAVANHVTISFFHVVTEDNPVQMAYPVYMVCRDLLGHLVSMDVTEPKETWAVRGRLDPRDHLVLKERKEQKENLGSRVPPAKKESEGTKATVELLGSLHT